MTNAEAIKAIKAHCYFANLKDEAKEALDIAIKALSEPTIPLSVIGDIKAEIERESDYKPYEMYDMKWAFNKTLSIIDKAVKECTHETRRISDCSHGN